MTNRQIQVLPKESEKSKNDVVMKVFYTAVRLLCCFDLGFSDHESVKRRVFWKAMTILQSLFMISLAFYFMEEYDNEFLYGAMLFYYCYYFMIVLILISLSPKKTFCQLHHDLKTIDSQLQISSASFKLEIKIVSYSTLLTVSSFIVYTYDWFTNIGCGDSIISSTIYLWLTTTTLIVDSSCAFVFYSIYCRLKSFSSKLKMEDRDNLSMQFIYQSIVNLTEMHKSALESVFLLTIISTIYEIMTNILDIAEEIRLTNNMEPRIQLLIVAINLTSTSVLALSAEFLSMEGKNVINILNEKLVQERDSSRQRELERFIRYVEARPLRFRVYRLIPLDADLLGMVLNFSVTYLIVIIQFTYK